MTSDQRSAETVPDLPWSYPVERPGPPRPPRSMEHIARERRAQVEAWQCWKDPSHRVEPHPVFGWARCAEPGCPAAPANHERWFMTKPSLLLNLYVPPAGDRDSVAPHRGAAAAASIKDGSAIVAVPDDPTVYFEGFVHGAHGPGHDTAFATWCEGVGVAANRLVVQYPTTAKGTFPVPWVKVGQFFPATGLIQVSNPGVLGEWLGAEVPGPYTRQR